MGGAHTAIANIAIPLSSRYLSSAPSLAIWVVNAYQLAMAVAMLPLVALGERFGYRRVYRGGVLLLKFASLFCALSPSIGTLVASRMLQGLRRTRRHARARAVPLDPAAVKGRTRHRATRADGRVVGIVRAESRGFRPARGRLTLAGRQQRASRRMRC
ncbi:MFS transporter [Paraburkholderia sp. BL23I1N1]|uniref:MFS transporter n=1 Tax=Paraburkholderia sp. BL23I1N1 TaxID=1938802 RepID=UPI0016047939|nr:MFS transporter [Paraburkholderia sp. BL23I1N1]